MTNGSKEVTQKFLDRSKLDCVGPVLDVAGPRAWKPCRAAYQYVLEQLGLQPEQVSTPGASPCYIIACIINIEVPQEAAMRLSAAEHDAP